MRIEDIDPHTVMDYYVNKAGIPYSQEEKAKLKQKLTENVLRKNEKVLFCAETCEAILATPRIIITDQRFIKYNPGLLATGVVESYGIRRNSFSNSRHGPIIWNFNS